MKWQKVTETTQFFKMHIEKAVFSHFACSLSCVSINNFTHRILLHPYKQIQLLILPGLGGDHRMAHSQLSLPYDCITPDYIPFHPDESLEAYSRRFGEFLLTEHRMDPARPLFIAGYSLGSAVGQEIARFIPVRGLIVIGGLLSSDEIRLIPRLFGRYISWWLPLWVYRTSEIFRAPAMRMVSGVSKQEIELVGMMYRDLPRGLFREGYRAISQWKGCGIGVDFIRIHGEKDHIISCPKPGEKVVIIPSAKHLVGQGRPEAVNKVIEHFIKHKMSLTQ
jgi:pimeloyl-ACP methyl ester carboxylesterase